MGEPPEDTIAANSAARRHSTKLRVLSRDEATGAVHELVALMDRTVRAAARATGEEKLATIADLA
jgi:hypothetical protein